MQPGQRAIKFGVAGVLALLVVAGVLAVPRALAQKARPTAGSAPLAETAPTGAPPPPAVAPPVEPRDPGPPASATVAPAAGPPVRELTPWKLTTALSMEKLDEVQAARLAIMRDLFAAAKVSFPPATMLFRTFKKEMQLETWAASKVGEPLTHITTHAVCAASGTLGPKRKQGDMQVPEGFYTLVDYQSTSRHFPALLVSYPNASDRILGQKGDPGGEIMIHGRCHSKGCISMADEGIQELWLTATAVRSAGNTVAVHVFPSRDPAGLAAETKDAALKTFWENLAEGLHRFEDGHRLPTIDVDSAGRYLFR